MASEQSARDTAAGTGPGTRSSEAGRQYVPRQGAGYEQPRYDDEPQAAAMGFTIFAAVVMMISGAFNFFQGLAGIIHGSFVVVVNNYAYSMSTTAWGWFHLILGCVVFVAGAALFADKTWARVVGVALAGISMVVNFLYVPYQPVWSIIMIALDAAVIWALLTPRHRRI